MNDEQVLDRRLRDGLQEAARSAEPATGGLAAAIARGRRRRTTRAALTVSLTLVPFLLALGVRIGLSDAAHRTTSAPLTAAALAGQWRTPALPPETWRRAYVSAGGTPAGAAGFVGQPMGGAAASYQVIIDVTDSEWTVWVHTDRTAVSGFHGTYTMAGDSVQVHDADYDCDATYRVTLSGGRLRVGVVADTCGGTDLLTQRTILEAATFTRR